MDKKTSISKEEFFLQKVLFQRYEEGIAILIRLLENKNANATRLYFVRSEPPQTTIPKDLSDRQLKECFRMMSIKNRDRLLRVLQGRKDRLQDRKINNIMRNKNKIEEERFAEEDRQILQYLNFDFTNSPH